MDPNTPTSQPSELDSITKPAAPAAVPLRPKRWRVIAAGSVVGLSLLGVAVYSAVRFFGVADAPVAQPVSQPGLSEAEQAVVGQPKPLNSTILDVTRVVAQAAELGALQVDSLVVTGSATFDQTLGVQGAGTFGGTVTATGFAGDGRNVTNVDAVLLNGRPGSYYANLANLQGSLGEGQLPANVALRSAPNTFSASNTFSGGVVVSGSAALTGSTTISSLVLGAPLAVSSGGTGLSTIPVNGVVYGQGAVGMGVAVPSAAGQCLVSTSTDVQFGSCLGGAAVSSLNGLTGALTIANASGSGTVVTLNDASTAAKGIASFDATNFSVSGGVVNTVQNLAVTSAPTFAGLTLSGALTVANGGTGAVTAVGARGNLGAAASGANTDITSLGGLTTALSVAQGGTGATSLTANAVLVGNGTSAVTAVSGTNGECLVIVGGAPSFQSCLSTGVTSLNGQTGALTLAGNDPASVTTSGGAITLNDASTSLRGLASFNATNFTVTNGAVNTVQNIDATAAPTFGQLSLTGVGGLTLGVSGGSGTAGVVTFYDGSTAFGASINTLSLTANRIVRLPDESGVICLQTSTNCGFLASSAGSGFVQLQGVTPGSVQTGNLNISGTAIAATFKADDFDRATAGTLTVGNTNATVINLGTTAAGRTVNVGTGAAAQTVNIGSTNGASATTVSAGTGGLGFYTPANSSVSFVNNGVTAFNLDLLGRASFRPNADDTGIFNLQNAAGTTMFHADSTNNVIGTVGFTRLRSGYGGVNTDGAISIDPGVFGSYTTPLGTVLATKFSIANDDPGSFGSLIWAGLPSTANSNSRVLAVTDARTGTHEPTIAVVSPDEVRVGGFSWDGSNSTFAVKTSADGLAFKNSSGTALNLVQAAGYQIAALGGGGYNGALQLNNSTNTNSVSLTATSGVGNYVIDLPPALGVAGQCLSVASVSGNVQTLGYGACAGGSGVTLQASTPGSPDTGNFNISGTGIAGALQAPDFDRQAAGTLTFGSTNATAVEIGRIGTTTYIQGTLNTEYVQTSLLDRAVSGTLDIGTANATTINIGHAGVTTYFQDKINAEYVQTTDIDRAVPGNLALGSTNATSISLGQSTTLAAGKSLTVTGGDTGSRPASPTEGMIYFDTDTKKLLTYSNGKWQADRTTAVIVAASTSSQSDKDAADFVATGTNDQTTITNAIGSLPGTSGGTVYLMDGIYYFGASLTVSRPLMALVGGPTRAAVIYRMFNGSSLANGSLIKLDTISPTIKNLYLHGNSATYTNTFNNGIYSTVNTGNVKIESSVFSRSAGSSVYMDGDINRYNAGSIVRDNDFGYSGQNAVYMNFGDRNQVLDNRVYISSDVGINAVQSNNTLIANNTVTQATNTGIHLGEGSGNAVTGNTVSNSNQGFSGGSWGLTVTGNSLSGNADTGLELGGFVSGLAVSGNNISGNGDGIRILPGVQQLVINGNKINFNAGYGIGADVATAVRNVAISGNVISENDEEGILLVNQVYDTSISDNNFMDNGGTGAFSSIVNNGASGNSITGNTIRDSAGTGYAIEIGGGAGNTYLANNTFSGVGSASILDLSLSTVYDGQMTSAADGFVFRGSSDSSAAFQIQNSSGDTLLNVDTSSGNIRLSAAFQVQTAAGVNVLAADNATGVVTLGEASSLNGQLSLANATNANTATLASGVTTASYTTVLPTGIGVAGQCLNVASVSGSTQTLGYGACGTSTGVTLQAGTPGTPDTGNLNISGTGIFGTAVSTAQLVAGGQSILGGDNDQVQLVVKADAGQSPNNPLVMLQDSLGNELARLHANGSGDLFLGSYSGQSLTVSSGLNSGIGDNTLVNLTTGGANTAVGAGAGFGLITGSQNTLVGEGAAGGIEGNRNAALGVNTLGNMTTGDGNVAIGANAGYLFGPAANSNNNVFVGYSAGSTDSDGFMTTAGLQGAGAIGAFAQVQQDNTLVLGGAGSHAVSVVVGSSRPFNNDSFGVSPVFYSTGTASQSGTAVTGVGTSWQTAGVKVGMRFLFADGSDAGEITAVNSDTSLDVLYSQTVSAQAYRIHHMGLQVTNFGDTYVQGSGATVFSVRTTFGSTVFNVDADTMTVTAANMFVSGNIDVLGQVTVGDIVVNQHIVSGGSAPTFLAGSSACTAPTVSVTGTDTAGTVEVTTGTGCVTTGLLVHVMFAAAYSSAPHVSLTPASATAANLKAYIDDAAANVSTFDLSTATVPTDTTTYKWYYQVIQ